jgi:aspartyl protease family protein
MRSVISFAAFALVASIIVPRYAMQSDHRGAAPAMAATTQGGSATTDSRSVIVRPNRQGHFQVDGRIDGRRLTFMVDTGASVIALTADDAASLGIHPAQHDFRALMQTANGKVYAAPVELNLVEIEDVTVHNVPAIVMPAGALAGNLLGMSFLSRLHRWEFADGQLVLEQ